MKKIMFTALIFMLFVTSISFGQLVTKVMSYNGPGNQIDKCTGIVQDKFGYVYATGVSWGSGTAKEDYATIKFGEDGDYIWAVRYNGPGNNLDYASAITIDDDGNIYVTGWSRSGSDYGTEDYCTIKYNNNGQQLWVKRFDGAVGNDCHYYDYARAIFVDTDGNVYVTGESLGNDDLNGDYLTLKYNSAGTLLWSKRYNGPSSKNDNALSISVDFAGNVFVTGGSQQQGKGYDYLTVKYNSAGTQQWAARYDGPAYLDDIAKELKLDGAGNVYITGSSHGGTSKLDYATIKYNTSGQQQWLKRYTNTGINDTDAATGLDLDVFSNVYVTGYSKAPGSASYDYVTIKYHTNGTQLWLQRCNEGDVPQSLDFDEAGNVYVTGEADGNVATVKYNSYGVQIGTVAIYNSQSNGFDRGVAVTTNNNGSNIYVVCMSAYTDVEVIRYSQLVGVYNSNTEVPERFQLSQNYPNPFNPSTVIKFSLPIGGHVKLSVFDISGKIVEELLNEKLEAGNFSIDFNASQLSSGAYFYRIETEGFTDTKKMILVK